MISKRKFVLLDIYVTCPFEATKVSAGQRPEIGGLTYVTVQHLQESDYLCYNVSLMAYQTLWSIECVAAILVERP